MKTAETTVDESVCDCRLVGSDNGYNLFMIETPNGIAYNAVPFQQGKPSGGYFSREYVEEIKHVKFPEIRKYYVTMTDTFMSGWGMAKNKINKVVAECLTFSQAEIIARNARKRDEMRHVSIVSKKPRYNTSRYYVSNKTFDQLGAIWKG